MSAVRTVSPDAVDVHPVALQCAADQLPDLAATLTDTERARAERLRDPEATRRAIVSRARLREILGSYLGLAPGAVTLTQASGGKPELAGGATGLLSFNASRRDDLAVIAVCGRGRVGVDIELLRRLRDLGELAAVALADTERRELMALPVADRSREFLIRWTAKEAFLKARGDGLRTDPRKVPVEVDGPTLRISGMSTWYLHSFEPSPGWVGSVCCDRDGLRLHRQPPVR